MPPSLAGAGSSGAGTDGIARRGRAPRTHRAARRLAALTGATALVGLRLAQPVSLASAARRIS